MADSVRGRDYLQFPAQIQKGVLLHRAIDTFTDTHPITRKSSKRLHSRYRHYSMVIVDIYYDHFLARNWDAYSDVSLEKFTDNFYTLLEENLHLMPETVQQMTPYMITDNWLLSYRDLEGIHRVLKGLNRRTGLKSGMDQAVEELEDFYGEFEAEFTAFFDELIIFSRSKLATL
jgi:acyl carrier protein phosphodiesterase